MQGTFDGYVNNGVATVDWAQPGGAGRATFTIGADGHVEGTWGNGTSSTEGEWGLFRAQR